MTYGQRKNAEMVPEKNGNMSLAELRHDIRTHMHVVGGMADILAASTPMTDEQQDLVETLISNTERLNLLIENLFNFVETDVEVPDPTLSAEKAEVASPQAPADVKPCILLVEDYAPNNKVMASFLRSMGYEYDIAESGPEALNKFSHTHYDAVIMDIQMPEMDGLEAARRMRDMEKQENLTSTPILATTSHATNGDRVLCLKAGMNDYLSKPFLLDELQGKLESLLPAGHA